MERITKKIILAGNVGVGKTSLVKQFVSGIFSEEYKSTLGFTVDKKEVSINGESVNLLIWDVAGEANMIDILYAHYKSSDGIIYVIDITRTIDVEKILNDIQTLNKFMNNVPFLVIGNKIDLLPHFDKTTVNLKIDYLCSAKTGNMVEQMFLDMATQTLLK
jgi:small GTP-binding protein